MAKHRQDAVEQQRSQACRARLKMAAGSARDALSPPTAAGTLRPAVLAALMLVAGLLLGGCVTSPSTAPNGRPFHFDQDTFAYANELVWTYAFDAAGLWQGTARDPRPDYALHCFVVARSAKQFFLNARFDPGLPKADGPTYRRLIRAAVRTSPRQSSAPARQIVIPGYANLRDFSQAQESLLKEESGSFWQSYFQLGNWRMVFPFSRDHQEQTARRIQADVGDGRPAVLHLVRRTSPRINHGVVVYTSLADDRFFEFLVYDPNVPDSPVTLTYDRVSRTFTYPISAYFSGGRVYVYEVYRAVGH